MAEGKTLGVPSIKCESCEEAESAKFCIECNQPMCSKCIRIHGRVASSKTHNFIPLEEYRLLASTNKSNVLKAYCAKHQKKSIVKLCEDCLVAVCSECEFDHKGHKLNSGSFDDANFLHRVSAKKVPGLLELLQELKDLEDGSPEKIKLFKEAEKLVESWKEKLLDLLNNDADKLIVEIRDEILKHEQILADTSSKIKELMVKTDHQITKMSESRKISNTAKLLDQMSKCDKEVIDIKSYIEKVKASNQKQTTNDILPYKDEFQKAVRTVKNLFTKANTDIPTHSPFPRMELCAKRNTKGSKPIGVKGANANVYPSIDKIMSTNIFQRLTKRNYNLVLETVLPNSSSLLGEEFGLCETQKQTNDHVVTFELHGNNIRIFDSNLTEIGMSSFVKTILKMVMVKRNRYVIIESYNRNIYLTNEKFEVLSIIDNSDSKYKPYGLCITGVNQCMISEYNTDKGTTRLTDINLQADMISREILCEISVRHSYSTGLLVNHSNGHVTISDSLTTLSTVNPKTGKITKVHTSAGTIQSMCKEDDDLLVGTSDGCIYKVTLGQRSVVLLKGQGEVRGLRVTVSGFVAISGNKLQLYQRC